MALDFAFDYPAWGFLVEVAKVGCAVFGVIVVMKTIMKQEKDLEDRKQSDKMNK